MLNQHHGLAQHLQQESLLDENIIQQAKTAANAQQIELSTYLIKNSILSSDVILQCHAKYSGLSLAEYQHISAYFLQNAPIKTELMFRYRMLPIHYDAHSIQIAIADPTNHAAISLVSFHTGLRVQPTLIDKTVLDTLLNKYCRPNMYAQVETTLSKMQTVEEQNTEIPYTEKNDEPVINLVTELIKDAYEKKVSDIHLEPYQHHCRIRYRRDGLLYEAATLPPHLALRVITRLKILANLNIAEKRLPQDGRLSIHETIRLDVRISTCPTLYGEKIVLRLLEITKNNLTLSSLGFTAIQQQVFAAKISQPQGLILVTGPTGSGKTMTLYAALQHLNQMEKNISSVEDPIEIELTGINQVAVNPLIGLDFATALRAFLRQDPDIIMIGEIRDMETANIALQAAQTGHLVLSTMHTNSAAETITRLQSMGVTTHQLLHSIQLIAAQRLVRTLCEHCKKQNENTYHAIGCAQCHKGYIGRTGLFEILTDMTKPIIQETLWNVGIGKMRAGLTTYAELIRILGENKCVT